jgi:dolichyl-phosphate-mannose--protein O-mannosyl transferase
VLAGVAGGYLPWFLYQHRTIFEFYAVAFVPWVVLAVTYCLGLLLTPGAPRTPGAAGPPGRGRAVLAAAVVLAAVLAFWYFYPVLSAQVVPHETWRGRMWLPSWI